MMNLAAIARSWQALTAADYRLTAVCATDNAFVCVRDVRLELLALADDSLQF